MNILDLNKRYKWIKKTIIEDKKLFLEALVSNDIKISNDKVNEVFDIIKKDVELEIPPNIIKKMKTNKNIFFWSIAILISIIFFILIYFISINIYLEDLLWILFILIFFYITIIGMVGWHLDEKYKKKLEGMLYKN